jgi:hypothetical protein
MRIHPVIRLRVDRVHVGTSYRGAIYSAIRDRRAFLAMSRKDRRAILRQAIACHKANRRLYASAMGGR